jgi:hypothetical protein
MSQIFARTLRIMFGITLIVLGIHRGAQAKLLPPSENTDS